MEKAKNTFSEWLEKLQQESWQLELLISGFLLSMLFVAKDSINTVLLEQNNILNTPQGGMVYFLILFVYIACHILIINLIIHVLMRSLWIGAIGLRNVSGNINLDNLKLSPVFRAHLEKKLPTFDQFIERLENFCCLIFAFTFLLVFSILSFFLVLVTCITIIYFIVTTAKWLMPTNGKLLTRAIVFPLIFVFILFGLIYMIDFLTLGRIKRIKWFSRFYLPFYKFFSIISLSSVYRPLYYNMLDNPLGKKVMLSFVPYLIVLFFYSSIQYNSVAYFPKKESKYKIENYYYGDTENIEYFDPHKISLNKRYFDDDDFIEIFYPLHDIMFRYSCKSCVQAFTKNEIGFILNGDISVGFNEAEEATQKKNIDSLQNDKAHSDLAFINCIASHFEVLISDSLQQKVTYDFYEHPKSKQKGILATVDILALPRGKHFLDFKIRDSTNSVVNSYSIPFWKK